MTHARKADDLPLLMRYWRIGMRWRWVIIGVPLTALLLGLIITMLMTRQYTARATIEISRQQEKIVNVQGVEPENSAADFEFYQTQYALLKARSLAARVVKQLKLGESDQFFKSFGVTPPGTSMLTASVPDRLTQPVRDERTKVATKLLLDNIEIEPVRASRLVNVMFTSPDPQLAMQITNAWTQNFIGANLDRRFEATSYARTFLEGRLESLRQRMEIAERALVNYAAAQQIIDLSSSGTDKGQRQERPIVADDLATLNAALGTATAERIAAESRLGAGGAARSGSSPEVMASGAIMGLRQRRAELSGDYAKLMTQFEPGYPPALAINRQIAALDDSIAREQGRISGSFQSTYRDALAREGGLRTKVDELKKSLLDLRRRSIQYNIYQRDVDTNRELYNGLLQRYKEIGVAGGVGTNNVAIVDAAELPTGPSSPKLLFNLAFALFAGIVLTGAIVFALEQIDEAITDPSDVTKETGLPLLGTIPKPSDGHSSIDALADRKSPTAEAYLSVQTSLGFSTDHGVPRTLAVTSTRPAEGKSTTAYAIAQALNLTGRRAVLIDGDLRSPSVHVLLGMSNLMGVSNFLVGEENLESLMVMGQHGFKVMTAGPQPPNAGELLSSPRFGILLNRLLESYDHVIVDSPPVLGIADAPLIASMVEGVVYAIEARGARSSVIRSAIARLANANVLGVILTKFDPKKAHFGYGYDYGYGYGHNDKVS
ncbi:polysaccharide biosynthesis tyrosine autokinase [Sphingomonas sp.]|uniref:GumC family protein n=1 Tax=Sphingomonas sp. TaxID=28214 RepID=UPI0025D41E8D|nr:polysaccharide biosynthesis tyrosine autokinase [Sphingomonas sp.]